MGSDQPTGGQAGSERSAAIADPVAERFVEVPAAHQTQTRPERERPALHKRRVLQWITAGAILISAVAAWLLSRYASPLTALELKTYDLRYVLSGKQAAPGDVMLVLIDERTDQAVREPHIFWHPFYATVMRAASAGGARAIGLDVSFAISVEKWAPDLDRQMAAAFAEVSAVTPVVLAYDNVQAVPESLPLYMLASAQGSVGYANLTLDRDGFVRRQELRDKSGQESFPARLAAVSENAEWNSGSAKAGTLQLGSLAVPLDRSGDMLIHYWGPGGTFRSVSMTDVLSAAQRQDDAWLKKQFQGKVVLIGTTDSSDRQSTPYYLFGGGEGQTPGVEIQASTLETLLRRRFLRETSLGVQMALVLLAAMLAGLCITQLRFPTGPLVLVGGATVYLAASVFALAHGTVLPITAPMLALTLAGLTAYGAEALTQGRQRRLLQDVFGRYVSADIAQELLDYGEIPLGGTRQPVTVMFTDLRNYTSYCQGRDPHQVVEELNEYFADMSAEIKAHGGMINKFIGDGIMALFGAPLPHPDDARRAVACALKMVERNEEYNRRRSERQLERLQIGIGLHTGQAVVGNIGAPEKMEYTAIGDTVNVASRIESENKTFGTTLLISEATYQVVREAVIAEPAGSAKMKGVDEAMTLYKVTALV